VPENNKHNVTLQASENRFRRHYLTATEHGFSAFLFRFQNCLLPLFHLPNNNKRSVGGCQPQPPEKMTERRPFIDWDQPGGGDTGVWGRFRRFSETDLNAAFEVSLPLLLDPPAPFFFLLLSELLSGHGLHVVTRQVEQTEPLVGRDKVGPHPETRMLHLLLELLQFALALLVVAFAQHLTPLLSVGGLS
jgi:hypothetical protein